MTQIDFLPFTPDYAAMVASWASSAEEAAMWCGEQEFPVPARRVADWQRDDEVRAHLLIVGGRPVGYGELWLDAEEHEVELARIIIAPAARGKRLGRALVRGLLSEALETEYSDIFVRVHPNNANALRCYLTSGFVPVEAGLAQEWNAAQPVDYVWLRHEETSSPTI